MTLFVAGCLHLVIGNFLRGSYNEVGHNHGWPVYKKTEPADGVEVFCYYWNGHDEPTFRGWWFGPAVGSAATWAFNSQPSNVPPRVGWKVPYNEAVDDTLVISGEGVGKCSSQACRENAADYCANAMCGTQCAQVGNYCSRHQCPWQQAQNQLSRAERAPRRRGGKGKQGAGPY